MNIKTIVIRPVDEAQLKALQTILDGLKVSYQTEPDLDETDHLLSTEANKNSMEQALQGYKDGKGKAIKLEDLWK